ncbi:SDR family NAD(P)-dependent oxidoreductase [Streptomyces sparsogenes]|uniref:SDR family NAD(P)-dependent oxidoreductase n=1 Tax=Streptomyces sparsogenes TaxID=67365 RepID=UPI000826EB91|nr:SDR family oxidoreductase [Streptomyces sparsogenes]
MAPSSKTALLLGAGGGLGRAVHARLREDGWAVIATDVAELDLSKPGVVASFIKDSWEANAGFDALVHCAGLYPAHRVVDTTEEIFDRVMNVNTRSALISGAEYARLCGSHRRSGSMVFVSSGAARRARPGTTAYAASKAALEAVVRGLALETAALGLRCNAVAPGFVDVGSELSPVPPAYIEQMAAASPQGRVAQAADIVPVIAWLLGDEAAWVNGQSIPVDGGDSIGTRNAPNWLG